jgi:hypothetical protein
MEPNANLPKEEAGSEKNGFGKAVVSLVCGVISFILFFNVILSPPFAVAALILGVMARNEMKKLTKPKGRLFASFGICLGVLALALVALQFMAYVQHAGES